MASDQARLTEGRVYWIAADVAARAARIIPGRQPRLASVRAGAMAILTVSRARQS